MKDEPRHDVIATHVTNGIRNGMSLKELSKAMRAEGAIKNEIRIASSQVLAANAWSDKEAAASE